MGNKPGTVSWDPTTPVSFPDSFNHSVADIKHEHNGVSFATAHGLVLVGDLSRLRDERVTAYFVMDNVEGGVWYRIAGGDYRMLLARCKAESSRKLYLSKVGDHQINAVFRPHTFVEPDGWPSSTLVEPSCDELDVTVIRVRILEHKEAA